MIARLAGTLVEKGVTASVVDVAGVGYAVLHSLHTYEVLPGPGQPVTLLTYMHVREDALQLYGFQTADERRAFELLIGVSGVGPRVALAVLSQGCAVVSGFCSGGVEGAIAGGIDSGFAAKRAIDEIEPKDERAIGQAATLFQNMVDQAEAAASQVAAEIDGGTYTTTAWAKSISEFASIAARGWIDLAELASGQRASTDPADRTKEMLAASRVMVDQATRLAEAAAAGVGNLGAVRTKGYGLGYIDSYKMASTASVIRNGFKLASPLRPQDVYANVAVPVRRAPR